MGTFWSRRSAGGKFLLVVIGLLALGGIGNAIGGGSKTTTTTAATIAQTPPPAAAVVEATSTTPTTRAPSTTEAPTPTAQPSATVLRWGEAADLGGLRITVSKPRWLEDGAVAVIVMVENVSSKTVFYNETSFFLADSNSFQYDGRGVFTPILGSGDLQPGLKKGGYVTFVVPTETSIKDVQYETTGGLSNFVVHWQD